MHKDKSHKTERRDFLRKAAWTGILPFGFAIWRMFKSDEALSDSESAKELPINVPEGISFVGNYILSNFNGKLKIFSSECRHFGCKITNFDGSMFKCPCHGSAYDIEGKLVKGPATDGLKELRFRKDRLRKVIIVENS